MAEQASSDGENETPKRLKFESDKDNSNDNNLLVTNDDGDTEFKKDGSVHDTHLSLSTFQLKRVLNVNSVRKKIYVEGVFKGYKNPAIIVLEKKTFPEEEIFLNRGFFNEGAIIRRLFCNDIYGNYECFPTREHNGMFFTNYFLSL